MDCRPEVAAKMVRKSRQIKVEGKLAVLGIVSESLDATLDLEEKSKAVLLKELAERATEEWAIPIIKPPPTPSRDSPLSRKGVRPQSGSSRAGLTSRGVMAGGYTMG